MFLLHGMAFKVSTVVSAVPTVIRKQRSTVLPLGERGDASPLVVAAATTEAFTSATAIEHRRALAQFFTPPDIARFMAALMSPGRSVRTILDPAAGTGILACAACEMLPAMTGPVYIDAYEIDPNLARICHDNLAYARTWLAARKITLSFTVHNTDFVHANADVLARRLFSSATRIRYDCAILNPPYFKLTKNDPRAVAASTIVHGQPNIYALFMAVTANLLAEDGTMVSITPRSFTTGDYFRQFREHFFSIVIPDAVHLFRSRKDAFRRDAVLQENVIIRARRVPARAGATVAVSRSNGVADLASRESRGVPLRAVVDCGRNGATLHIPVSRTDDAIVRFVRSLPSSLRDLGLAVSTGPVVAFRARELLRVDSHGCVVVPLLWLHHVRREGVTWPLVPFRKPQFIARKAVDRSLLVRNDTYVLLRRFTSKEEVRRLTVAPIFEGDIPGDLVGFENHLNYIHRLDGILTEDEAAGLSAILGSALFDQFIRVSNGSTQVNATELRELPLPSAMVIRAIGHDVRQQHAVNIADRIVAEYIGLPKHLRTTIAAMYE